MKHIIWTKVTFKNEFQLKNSNKTFKYSTNIPQPLQNFSKFQTRESFEFKTSENSSLEKLQWHSARYTVMSDSSTGTTWTRYFSAEAAMFVLAQAQIPCDSSNRNLRDALITYSFIAQLRRIISLLRAKLRNYKPSLETWHFSQGKSNYWSKTTKYLNLNVCWILYCGFEIF